MVIDKLNIQPKVDNAAKKKMVTSNEIGANETLLANEVNQLVETTNKLVEGYNLLPKVSATAPIPLRIVDEPTSEAVYKPIEPGVYPNADGLVYDPAEGYTSFMLKNGVWTKDVVPVDSDLSDKVEIINNDYEANKFNVSKGFAKLNSTVNLPRTMFPGTVGVIDYYWSDDDFYIESNFDIHYLEIFSNLKGSVNVAYINESGAIVHSADINVNSGFNTILLNDFVVLPTITEKVFVFVRQNQTAMLKYRNAGENNGSLQYLTEIESAPESVMFSIFKPVENDANVLRSFDKKGLNPINPLFTVQNTTFLPNAKSNSGAAFSYTHPENYISSSRRLSGVHVYCMREGDVFIDFISIVGNPIVPTPAVFLNDISKNKFHCKKGWNYISEERIGIPYFDVYCYIGVRAAVGILGYNTNNPNNPQKRAVEVNGGNDMAEFTGAAHTYYIDTYNFDLVEEIRNGKRIIELPQGQIDLNQNVVLDNIKLRGQGVNCTQIKDTRNEGGNLIDLTNFAEVCDFAIKGQNISLNKDSNYLNVLAEIRNLTGVESDNGVTISGLGCRINNIQVSNFGGKAVVISGQSTRLVHSIISNVQAFNNFVGFEFTGSGEYCTLSNLAASNNLVGIKISAGNTFISSGTFNDNRIGLYMNKTGNDSHGAFTASQFNHSKLYSMVIDNISHGHSFTGCHVFEGAIYLVNSIGFNFGFGTIDAPIYVEGGKKQSISHTTFQDAYWIRENGVHHNFNGIPSFLDMRFNSFMFETGENDHIINNEL